MCERVAEPTAELEGLLAARPGDGAVPPSDAKPSPTLPEDVEERLRALGYIE